MLDGAVKVLKPIKDTVKAFEGEKEPTIHRGLERIYSNHYILNEFISDPNNCILALALQEHLKETSKKDFLTKELRLISEDSPITLLLNSKEFI